MEMQQVFGDAVRQTPFELGPDEFVRIEFGRIGRKGVGLDPRMALQVSPDDGGSMDQAPVPQQDQFATDVPEEMSEKLKDLSASDVLARVQAQVKAQASPPR
jgi:hypothetical protein